VIEQIAIDRAKTLFNCSYANVQAHSGSSANLAAFMALLSPGDRILSMDLNSGGHLTHGMKINFSGVFYEIAHYSVDPKTERINYESLLDQARNFKPKLIIAGYSNYSQVIDFKYFKKIADDVGAYLLVDMAHIAGLIAGGQHPNPFPYADVVTSTTHKTLRGPRGAIILSNNEEIAKKIDRAIFPGTQGGPLQHVIAGRAIAFNEALSPNFKIYTKQIVDNSIAFCKFFIDNDVRIVSGMTQNHLFTIDVMSSYDINGKDAEHLLSLYNITVNKNTIPFDKLGPTLTSGIRVGTPAMTTRGFQESEFIFLAEVIHKILSIKEFRQEIFDSLKQLLDKFPIYPKLSYDL
jgi:glycine hydroxymethyltransferase